VCPDLSIPPSILKDATAFNWQLKKNIYSQSKFYVTTPSQWLMDKVEQSILVPGIARSRVIPNGIDLSVFFPSDRTHTRERLGLPIDARIVLFAANGIQANIWKDFRTLRRAIGLTAEKMKDKQLLFLALGEDAPQRREGAAIIRFVPYQNNSLVMAQYFQAADIYLHAARAETFPNTVLEAMACGTPVIATKVGGIPEQVKDGVTGLLVPMSNTEQMAAAIQLLLSDDTLRQKMGAASAEHAAMHFNLEQQIDDFLIWYEEVRQDWIDRKSIKAASSI
jgi:glycosyltransferase involved in cell wall biosynthesis